MTPRQIELIQASWQQVVPISKQASEIFYARLFELDSSLRALFSTDMDEQGVKLMTMLTTVVEGLAQFEKLEAEIWLLGRRHLAYQVQDKDYDTVAQALLYTLEQGLGAETFDDELESAWAEAYGHIQNVMLAGAHASTNSYLTWKESQH
ncbi:globin family protein [Flocculibacter collagenilyticus]|uniref:globin family protein n=1 Tax=Flocculibacter collagenilyticus TaxID=2744479 RepID=UPI0018F604DD|nr:globin family protein [Flocculibacter collagenilyticus]